MLLWLKGALSPQEIRDRILDPTSDFQKKIVEYLESVHIGEFMTGSMQDVKDQVDENQEFKSYKDPTQILPDPPPPMCTQKECSDDDCSKCKKLDTWWEKFEETVDDIVLRSNVHNCRKNKINDSNFKRPACINKDGKCKARFPRQVYEQTEVDLKTGALNIKKGEAWINTFTPIVAYLFRCNSDATSLMSGTAIRAVIGYVSDYVTKPGLKTHVIFDAVRSIFQRNTEMLAGSLKVKEKARKLVTQTVNCLTAKMEIGGPMAALYLLGNPDHYTSHKFVAFYWKNYVREVLKSWRSEEDLEAEIPEKVVVQKDESGEYVGFSKVHDYVYRPKAFEDKTLYEWVQMSTRVKISKTEMDSDDDDISTDEESDSENDNDNEKTTIFNTKSGTDTDNENDDSDDCSFLKGHPLHRTHKIQFDQRKNNIVPNFIGGSLPRCDRGDREYYCATMLTLFKPWRTGLDLKEEGYSWDETFVGHEFTDVQKQYECNDARDDYAAQLKKGDMPSGNFPEWMDSDLLNDLDEDNADFYDGADFGFTEDINDEPHNQYIGLGKIGKSKLYEMEATRIGVKEAGWLDESPNGIDLVNKVPLHPEIIQSGAKWKAAVLAERNRHLPEKKAFGNQALDPNQNNVKIVDQSYLTKKFKLKEKADYEIIKNTINNFELNTEQERAFRIIAQHAVDPRTEQLKICSIEWIYLSLIPWNINDWDQECS
ncbi:hypothetical protein BDZ94DRAFT_1293114 [Collybia nuda]|uniref:Uncharacterized protein n=1 Tax=Collybia nuda TaxID=64659 RepID=A0A9P5XQA3_9AGAR|nr:hypothetical protein BDZ94DRAFT_1293114 [Collybia nuda]